MPPPVPPIVTNPPAEAEPAWPIPKLSIRVEDLSHLGATIFFEEVHPTTALRDAVVASFKWLYTHETVPTHVKSIHLILRSMDGVAYTSGTHTDKVINFSLDHINNSASHARAEILGVLTHEVVHCFQYNGNSTCPGGLIEGIADFVRLHAGFVPKHWKRSREDKWDAGYQNTAYFLDWIEERYGQGTIRELNECMRDEEYVEEIFKQVTGRRVGKLWKLYCGNLEEEVKLE